MTWFALSLFLLTQLNVVQAAARYVIGDTEGILAIVILVAAGIVCLISAILFAYIIYKLWNGLFGRRYARSDSKLVIVHQTDQRDEKDAGSHYSTMTTDRVHGSVNRTVIEEVQQEEETGIVETTVDEHEFTTEEVIVTNAPATDQAEMETQELVIVFDTNDDVVDVFTHVT